MKKSSHLQREVAAQRPTGRDCGQLDIAAAHVAGAHAAGEGGRLGQQYVTRGRGRRWGAGEAKSSFS